MANKAKARQLIVTLRLVIGTVFALGLFAICGAASGTATTAQLDNRIVVDQNRNRPTEIATSPVSGPPYNYAVLFDFDSVEITPTGNEVIQLILNKLRSHDGYLRITLTGRADRSGAEDYNLVLSVRRAEAVAQALIAGGVAASQITIVAHGESDNTGSDCR